MMLECGKRIGLFLSVLLLLSGCQNEVMPTAVAPTSTTFPTLNPSPTITQLPNTQSPINPSPTIPITLSPTHPVTQSPTPIPSATVTASTTPKPYATIDQTAHPPGTAVPTPIPSFAKPDHIVNIILLGNDVTTPQGGRTDSLILVSIDKENQTATMLSLPRDLYVLIPGWRMTRINLALPHGHGSDYPGGGGQLIKDTIEYNLGIPVDYYARIGFNGFKEAVDAVGGIEMIVNCPLTDWRLLSPELDPEIEENWAEFTLEPGVHEMDGDLALWFARSRRTTNDFERGLRQQRVLQAILNKGINLDLLPQLPDLWAAYQHNIETDMPLSVMLELAALATAVEQNGIEHLTLPLAAFQSWRAPDGGSVQLLQWPEAEPVLQQVMQPPTLNRANRPPIVVEVVTSDYIMYRQMADNLAWYGFVPQHTAVAEPDPPHTTIEFFGPNRKGSYDWLISWLFHHQPESVLLSAEAKEVDFRVTLGQDADPCLSYLLTPQE